MSAAEQATAMAEQGARDHVTAADDESRPLTTRDASDAEHTRPRGTPLEELDRFCDLIHRALATSYYLGIGDDATRDHGIAIHQLWAGYYALFRQLEQAQP